MTTPRTNLFTRPDTVFGVCEAIGEDFGFHANFLRMALGVSVQINPIYTLAAYGGLGVAVIVSRWIMPNRTAAPASAEPVPATASNDDPAELQLAA